MTNEEAALILDPETSRDALWKYEDPAAGLEACNEACRLGAAALRAQQEREHPKPLALDEIKREMYVWVEPLKDWAKVTQYGLLYFGTEDYTSWRECGDLGQLWNAYRHKPKEN